MVAEAGGAAVSARDTSARPRPAFRLLNGKLILSSGCGDFIEYRGLVERRDPVLPLYTARVVWRSWLDSIRAFRSVDCQAGSPCESRNVVWVIGGFSMIYSTCLGSTSTVTRMPEDRRSRTAGSAFWRNPWRAFREPLRIRMCHRSAPWM